MSAGFLVYKSIAAVALPPGLLILLALAAGFLLHRWSRRERAELRARLRWVQVLCFLNAALLYSLSLPPLLDLTVRAWARPFRPIGAQELKAADAIVVLGSGFEQPPSPSYAALSRTIPSRDTTSRLVEAAVLARATAERGIPLVVSGGSTERSPAEMASLYARFFEPLGVGRARLVLETRSRTTMENAGLTSPLLRSMGSYRPVLVTSAVHMRRALYSFRRYGVDPMPAPADTFGSLRPYTLLSFLPNPATLSRFREVLWELAGTLWYRIAYPPIS